VDKSVGSHVGKCFMSFISFMVAQAIGSVVDVDAPFAPGLPPRARAPLSAPRLGGAP
jgi:hypothetical protein